MLSSNPFAALFSAGVVSQETMQIFLLVMVVLVVAGTILDMVHKKSAKYFFANAKKAEASRKREVGGGEKIGIAMATLTKEVLTSGEFANPKRRLSHLMTMYGTIAFIASTLALVFTNAASDTWAMVWHVGAISVMVGGYWFWFFIRVDVAAEGIKWYQLRQADLFIVSLLAMTTFGVAWSLSGMTVLFWLFMISTVALFGGVRWSKFAHMFFKPAAAFQKRMTKADGSRENLPAEYDLNDPTTHERYPDIPTYMGKNPPNMGLGIKREAPKHY